MENTEKAKQIGLKYGIWSALILIVLLIVSLMIVMLFMIDDFKSSVVSVLYILFYDRLIETVLGLASLSALVWKLTPRAGHRILVLEEEYTKEGAFAFFLIYAGMAIVMILASYVRAGLKLSSNFGQISEYLTAPLSWSLIIGFIPIAFAGIWFGNKVDGFR